MTAKLEWSFEIKIGDTDLYGHMNHVAYFSYIEEATVRLLRANGIFLAPGALTPLVASVNCKYINAVGYPTTIVIDAVGTRISSKKLLITHTVKSPDSTIIYAVSEKIMVWYDFQRKSAVDLPDYVVELFPFVAKDMVK